MFERKARTSTQHLSRRAVLKLSTAAAIPFILPSHIYAAAPGPNSLVNMAFIGMGAQNRGLLNNFLYRAIKVRAVCDVDTNRRNHALEMVRRFHADDEKRGAFDCVAVSDFREIMARKDIDAVCIATPDHWHALITLAAVRAGKDVYCEKPLTHNIHEAIEVMAAVKKHERVLQTGSMQRSMAEFRVACELVRNGVIGKLTHVNCFVRGPAKPCDLPEQPMEPGLDWDRWLGPAPMRPYNSVLCPRGVHNGFPNWRGYREYGGGSITDFGAHHFDIAQWGLGMDESGPVEVHPPADPLAEHGAVMVYENGLTLTQVGEGCGMRTHGIRFYGTDGEVEADRGSFFLVRGAQTMTRHQVAEKEFLTDAKIRLYRSKSHTDDFLERVADRQKPVASEIAGGHTAILCHLVNQAYYHHKTLRWNPQENQFVDNTGDPSWLTREYRKPWTV